MKIGIIGVGNIGKAIVSGLAKSAFVPEENIVISDIEKSNLELIKSSFPKIQSSTENKTAAQADIVIVAVKPWLVGGVLTEIAPLLETSRPILVVVAAGVSFEQIYGKLPENLSNLPCYRFIPNTAIALRESMSLLSAANTTPEQDKLMMGMLKKLGKAVLIHPDMMAAGTSLTSCGTGFALQFIKANVQVAIEMGFTPEQATELIAQTVKGAAELLLNNKTTPEVEIRKVTTPGGITIRGLNEMEASGFTASVIKGIKASLL